MNRRYFLGVALGATAAPALAGFSTTPLNQPRVLSFYHLHTDASIDVVYRIGNRYQLAGIQKLNHFLRDFRTDESTSMDPRLFDLIYDLKLGLGDSHARFDVISGYRSPTTNSMLRSSSHGVAKNSLHLTGQAIDVRLPDLPLRRLREAAIELNRGGVGYYRRADFVHLDTGAVRQWGA